MQAEQRFQLVRTNKCIRGEPESSKEDYDTVSVVLLRQLQRKIIETRKSAWFSQFCTVFLRVLDPRTSSTGMRFIGLGTGSLSREDSLRQVAFLISLLQIVSLEVAPLPVSCECFDPLFSECDARILSLFGVAVPMINLFGAYRVPEGSWLVAFMPHCGRSLYHNLLVGCWNSLSHLVLIGNDLTKYNFKRGKKKCAVDCVQPAILVHQPVVSSMKKNDNAFSDLCLSTFHLPTNFKTQPISLKLLSPTAIEC